MTVKPLYLTIEGINSFIEPRSVDFERLSGEGIFCICGPTGSGKTTVLDCVILALYAPSNHHRGSLKDYINTKCDKGKITLDFSADGKRYRVYREFRRNSSSAGRLTCLDTGEVLADKADTVTEKIKAMLHLGKDDFTKVVVLEQGRFAEFMQMGKSDRCKTVAKLFRLERFERLKDTAAAGKRKYESLLAETEAALGQYEGITEAALAERKKRLAELTQEETAAQEKAAASEKESKVWEERRACAERVRAARAAAEEALAEEKAAAEALLRLESEKAAIEARKVTWAQEKEKCAAAQADLQKAEECARDDKAIAEKEEKRKALQAQYKKADATLCDILAQKEAFAARRQEQEAAAKRHAEALASVGYAPRESAAACFAEVKAAATQEAATLRAAEEKFAAAAKTAAAETRIVEELFTEQNSLRAQAATASEKAAAAQSAYEAAKLRNAAAAVRSALHEGDVCPVCGGEYHENAGEEADTQIDALRAAWEACEKIRAETDERTKKNDVEYARHIELKRAAEKARDENALPPDKSAQKAQQAAAAAAAGLAAAEAAAECEKQMQALTTAAATAAAAREKIETEGKTLRAAIEDLRQEICERLGGRTREETVAAAQKVLSDFERVQKETEAQSAGISAEITVQIAKAAAAQARGKEAKKALMQLDTSPFDFSAAAAAAEKLQADKQAVMDLREEKGKVGTQAAHIAERLARKKELMHRKKEISRTLDDVLRLYKCVERDNKLLSFVAEEYVQSFTAAASETLSFLSGGKYTLIYDDGEFYVEDFFAENARRKVKTLSGGETFLASVSIAMAISREIAAQNYEFFFLDEGFGTLHERALETVTEALMALSRDTTVGIVTHRSELADRIPARLDVVPATEDEGSDVRFVG